MFGQTYRHKPDVAQLPTDYSKHGDMPGHVVCKHLVYWHIYVPAGQDLLCRDGRDSRRTEFCYVTQTDLWSQRHSACCV